MSELRQSGTEAISIEHIEDIINRVGKPEQFMDDVAENIEMSIATESPASPRCVWWPGMLYRSESYMA